MGLFGPFTDGEGAKSLPPPFILNPLHLSHNDETWQGCTLATEDPKNI